jgi:tetratricopeptide (TPR) repeat protein
MKFRVGEKLLRNFKVTDIKRGGLGIVYILYNLESKKLYAFKSFQERYFKDRRVVEDFYREAETWAKLRKHRNIVEAFGVIQIEGQPYILLEYVDGGNLRQKIARQRLDFAELLSYAIQFCEGMINAKYIELDGKEKDIVHRDIKPENIMLTKEGTLKITDFGLVKALGAPSGERPAGTPEYMSPEQFDTMDVDQRSDIYSFGVVLYEMFTGRLPFWTGEEERRWVFCEKHHKETQPRPLRQIIPEIPATLEETVLKCLEKKINDRYQSFKELREELVNNEKIHFQKIPETFKENAQNSTHAQAERVCDIGASLRRLGKEEEAIRYFDKALEIDPRCAMAWAGKGASLDSLDRIQDSLKCYDKALEINPRLSHVWNNKGISLARLNILDQALKCYEKALEIDPEFFVAWANKANALEGLGRTDEAITCYNRALQIDPEHGPALLGEGNLLYKLNRFKEALPFFDKALEKDFNNTEILKMKILCLMELNRINEAVICFERVIQIESPFEDASLWRGKAMCLEQLGRFEEAIECCDKALEYEPRNAGAWILKASCLRRLGRFEESKRCYEKAMKLKSRTER